MGCRLENRSNSGVLDRLRSRGGSRGAKSSVKVGDLYEESGPGGPIWEVSRVSQLDASVYPLVVLKRLGMPDLERALSIHALEDRSSYQPTQAG